MVELRGRGRLRCFLSSPFLVDTEPLRRVLTGLNVELGSIEEFPSAGQSPVELVSAQIRRASFVLGVITGEENAAVLFELGLATGLGKPVFLIADDKERLASSLLSLPLVVAPLTDTENLRFHLEAFLASLALPRQATTAPRKPPRFYGGGEAVSLPRSSGSPEARSEQRVEAAFRRAGANVTVSPQIAEGSEADMIVWLPDLDLGLGGPLLVEVKSRATEAFPVNGIRQVERLLCRSHLRAAVLVTNAPDPGVSGRVVQGAFVYAVSIPELERLAEAGKLTQELKRIRNRLAHGVF
jgi:hypothetical protein